MRGGCRILFMGPDSPPRVDGVEPVWVPLVAVEPRIGASIDLVKAWAGGDLLVFTSPRGPRLLALDALHNSVYDRVAGIIRRSTVAVVGPATRESLYRYLGPPGGLVEPGEYTVRGLARAIIGLGPGRVVALRASSPSRVLDEVLGEAGVEVVNVTVYDNSPVEGNAGVAASLISDGVVDAAVFSSPMQARLVAGLLPGRPRARIYSIGPETGRILEEYGLEYSGVGGVAPLRRLALHVLRECRIP